MPAIAVLFALLATLFLSVPARAEVQKEEPPLYTLHVDPIRAILHLLDEEGRLIKEYRIAAPDPRRTSKMPQVGLVRYVDYSAAWFPTKNIKEYNAARGIFLADKYLPGDPGNAIGGVWIALGLADPNIGLHGTNRPNQIGMRVSFGCFRMHNHEWREVAVLVSHALRSGRTVRTLVDRIPPPRPSSHWRPHKGRLFFGMIACMKGYAVRPLISIGVSAVLMLSLGGYGALRFSQLAGEHRYAQNVLASTSAAYFDAVAYIRTLEGEKESLSSDLASEKSKNEFFAGEIGKIAGTVGTLEKLSKTDPELLQKYSKIYFLNEHYQPASMVQIAASYAANPARENWVHAQVAPHLTQLLAAAEGNATPLRVVSAFRSFDEQSQLKSAYTVTYGSGANTFSADQGYSEHQLGTTVDLTTAALAPSLAGFGETKGYQWLLANAHLYGFILSYPKDNDYYIYEPWHWRYVGIPLAEKLHAEGRHFYDLNQREIDEYLVELFD